MKRNTKRKCKNCQSFFPLDPRNKKRQNYCSKPMCRKASKSESQRKWLNKEENKDYFRCPENTQRVRQWRLQHPGYWRRAKIGKVALQDLLTAQPDEIKKDINQLKDDALQDLLIAQPFVLLGLIAHFTGTALQDDIDTTVHRLQQLGRDIAAHKTHCDKGGFYGGVQTSYRSPPGAKGAAPVQLAGSSAGP
jgi:hypothetical protein